MNKTTVFKIKDSLDLFLMDEKILTVYYMNSRKRKNYRVNKLMIELLENIDGEKSVIDLYAVIKEKFEVEFNELVNILEKLLFDKIICEKYNYNKKSPKEYVERYQRQLNYLTEFLDGEEKALEIQKTISKTKILIFGCGAIGGNIALELAMAGIEHFVLFDAGLVRESDISRHMYYSIDNIGQYKTEALKNEIIKIIPDAEVVCMNERLWPSSDIEPIIELADFVINTMDEPYIGYTSAKISRICIKHHKPHYIGGGFDAHLASTGELIIPYITPCVECYANHFKVALKNWKPRQHPLKDRSEQIGGLPSMSLFSSSYACIEILKFLTGIVDQNKSYKARGELLFNSLDINYLDINKDPNCQVCGEEGLL